MENRSKTVNVDVTPTPNRSRRPPQRLIDDDVWPQKVLNLQLLLILFMCGVFKINFEMNSISISLQFSLMKFKTKKC